MVIHRQHIERDTRRRQRSSRHVKRKQFIDTKQAHDQQKSTDV